MTWGEKMSVTIKDVANLAGTSTATVSRVINGSPNVTEKAKKKVRAAIEELGYTPNPVGRMLKSGVNKSIMVILPYKLSSFYGRIVDAMTQEAIANDYTLLISTCNDDREYERTVVNRMLKDVVKGFVFLGTFFDSHELEEINRQIPVVLCCEQVERSGVTTIVSDYAQGAELAVERMIAAGHRRIGYIAMRHRPASSMLKQKGFSRKLAEQGIEQSEEYYFYGSHSQQTGYSAMRYFGCLDEPPTAIFAETDLLAMGALNYAMENGMDIGGEVVIAGFDDLDICSVGVKKMSSVRQPLEEIGRAAVRSLIGIIEEHKDNSGVQTLPVTLTLRDTLK